MSCGEQVTRRGRSGVGLLVAFVIIASVGFGLRPVSALQIRVNSPNDPGSPGICTIRDAVQAANTDTPVNGCTTGSGDDEIVFNLPLPATIKLTAELLITDDLTISGPATGLVALDGQMTVRILDNPGSTVIINHLTLQNGKIAGAGAGIYNNGDLTLNHTVVDGSTASTNGGGIYNDGSGALTLTESTVSRNTATGGMGGGIYNNGTIVSLIDSTFSDNTAGGDGGGLWNNGEMLTVRGTTFVGNKAPNGCGGGLFNGVPEVTIANSTFSGNTAANGGGVCNTSEGTAIVNVTISGNSATSHGSGLFNSAALTLTNTIVANSLVGRDCFNNGPITNSHNLIELDSVGDECSNGMNGDIVGMDPLLAPLGYYGGPTQTFAPCEGSGVPDPSCAGVSPAIDAGDDSVIGPPFNLLRDQRGLGRLSGLHVDIGADEVQQPRHAAPTVSTIGMVILAVLLGAFGWWRPRTRRTPLIVP